jgi:hypothetical protein
MSSTGRYAASAQQFSSTRTKNNPMVHVDGNNQTSVDACTNAARSSDWPVLPWARGPLSAAVISALQRPSVPLPLSQELTH